mmetsp:Transcript_34096/g.57287  ORF Transcript_34096/g.57287 Transcript_34096/m.57287 type:complete len:224 (-) Transcript_34096:294-965(-)
MLTADLARQTLAALASSQPPGWIMRTGLRSFPLLTRNVSQVPVTPSTPFIREDILFSSSGESPLGELDDDLERERRYARVTHALRTSPVVTHAATDRVAIFGDDPSRRGERNLVEKNLAPFASLEQFGTPWDVDSKNTNRILSRITRNSYDVVYVWSRFGCHSSRASIRKACAASQTRFEEIRSLHRFLGSVHRFLGSYVHGTTDVSDDHSSSNVDAGRGSIC